MQDFLVSGLRRRVEKIADEFDPARLTPLMATAAIEEWARIEKIACAQKLRAATCAEDAGLDAEGAVADSSGVSTGAARRQTKAARKARKHRKTKEAFDKGRLSPAQAEAIAEAADANPSAEESLLELAATGTTTDLLNECERVRREATDDRSRAAQQRAARHFRSWTDALGMTRFSGALEPLLGAKLVAELNQRADRMFREQWRARGAADTVDQRMADALASLVETAGSGGGRKGPRAVVRLIVTKDAVDRGYIRPGEKCQTAEGRPIPMPAVEEALLDKDTVVQEVEVDAVDVRTIKTLKRYIPKRIRDALEARGVCCVVPGCGRTKHLQIDHTQEIRDMGITELANLAWRCPYHHRLKTRRLYDSEPDGRGGWTWEPTGARARAPAT